MDYAENILRKYGWKEGEGLGKDKGGISKPLKCGLKFDRSGVGYQEKRSKEENDQWWIQMFNQAASNISSSDTSARGNKRKNESKSSEDVRPYKALTDEELFAACGGRTAHKAARHGFRLNGKLNRINQQESNDIITDTSTREAVLERVKSNKKRKSNSSRTREEEKKISINESDLSNGTTIQKVQKSKKIANQPVVSVNESDAGENTDHLDENLRYNANCSKSKKSNKKKKRTNV